jgi:hypothetical protein
MKLIPILLILLGGLLFWIFESIYHQRKKFVRFRGRENLELDEIFDRYFASCGVERNEFKKIIVEVANVLHVPAGKLRPTDSFNKELKPADVFDWDNDDLVSLFYQRMWKRTGKKTKELPQMNTLGDYIKAMKQYL